MEMYLKNIRNVQDECIETIAHTGDVYKRRTLRHVYRLIDYNLYASHGWLACTRVFLARGRSCFSLSLSFFPLEAEKRRGGGGGIKKNDALAARHTNERTKFPECKRGTARSACALADCSAPRIDLSIVFERRRPRLPQTFVYKCEYRSSYRRLERLNAPHSTLHYARLFSLPLPPPRLIPLLDSCLFRANSNVGFQFRRRSFAQRFEMERL